MKNVQMSSHGETPASMATAPVTTRTRKPKAIMNTSSSTTCLRRIEYARLVVR